MHYVVCFKTRREKKKINSTATSSNKNYINYCLKYFPQRINYKGCFIFYRLY